jgi:hypothetical protein
MKYEIVITYKIIESKNDFIDLQSNSNQVRPI